MRARLRHPSDAVKLQFWGTTRRPSRAAQQGSNLSGSITGMTRRAISALAIALLLLGNSSEAVSVLCAAHCDQRPQYQPSHQHHQEAALVASSSSNLAAHDHASPAGAISSTSMHSQLCCQFINGSRHDCARVPSMTVSTRIEEYRGLAPATPALLTMADRASHLPSATPDRCPNRSSVLATFCPLRI